MPRRQTVFTTNVLSPAILHSTHFPHEIPVCSCHLKQCCAGWPSIVLPLASQMIPPTTCLQNSLGTSFHTFQGMHSKLSQALPLCSTPGHHWVVLEMSAAQQLSGWCGKCPCALLLAPQALRNSLGIAVTWFWVGGYPLIFTTEQRGDWHSSPH